MSRLVVVARVLLGLPLLVFGANNFLQFIPQPPAEAFPQQAWDFLAALGGSGYLMELVGVVEVLAGLAFLSGRFVPLALAVYAPVMVNIVGFHVFLDEPANGVMAYVLFALYLLLVWAWWPSFRGVLAARGERRPGC